MKSIITLFIAALSLPITLSFAQKNKPANNTLTQTNLAVPLVLEKIYLHFDRPYYASGEDIWFKAYLVDAFSNKLTDNSNCLYVELISPDSKILQRRTIRMEKGTGYGDFHLKDSLPSGKYQIRAYTNWMRNFGEYFFFKKEIHMENINGILTAALIQPDDTERQVDFQFFPEGGSLVENVYSVVGFKAVNSSGIGCNVQGVVLTSTGDTITKFVSTHLGMGSFNFIPQKGKIYYASVTPDNGSTFKAELPVALKNGYIMKVAEYDKNNLRVTIKTNQKTLTQYPDGQLILLGVSRGKICITVETKLKNLVQNVLIPKSEFPEGIVKFTLLDNIYKPQSERLTYIQRNQKLMVNILPNKKVYAPREKVTLQIAVKDTSNNPVLTDLSLAVIDANQVKNTERYSSDICSYLLLESEIHGKIEQPAYYFDTMKTDRYKMLDLLLLTQGWRDFIWKHLSDSTIKNEYYIEKGLTVSGKLRHLLTNKPIAEANISLGIFGNNQSYINITKTDSAGKYYFNGLDFTGERTLIVSAFNKNHRSQGWISLDSLFNAPVPINYRWVNKPEKTIREVAEFKEEAELRHSILKKYKLSDTVLIDEVIIKARKNEDTDDGHFRIYGHPDYALQVTDQYTDYSDIFQLLQGRVAGLQINGTYPNISISIRGVSSFSGNSEPLFLLDGMPVDIDFIASIPVASVDKVEVLKSIENLAMFGSRGANGVISVFTKRGADGLAKPFYYSMNKKVYGFYQARTFYAPKYDVLTPENQKPDLRTTIHWEPNIVTDVNGKATVTFYNADKTTIINAEVEGLSELGIPVTGSTTYEVK